MKCLFYSDYGELELRETAKPFVQHNEVLIRVLACGICGSELESFKSKSPRRPPPLIMGHEFCGVIEAIGRDVRNFSAGEMVVCHSIVGCDQCPDCQRGDTHLCHHRQIFGMHRDGAFAELVAVPSSAIIRVFPTTDPKEACLAEPLANGIHVRNLTRTRKPNNIIVIGAGPIGLMVLQVFSISFECTLVVSDLSSERLGVARRLGAKHTIDASSESFLERVKVIFPDGADLVIDAAGTGLTNKQALDAVRPGGAVVLIGLLENAKAVSSYELILNEKTILGSYAARMDELREALDLIQRKVVDVSSWVTYAHYDKWDQAFTTMAFCPNEQIKAVLIP